MFHDMNADFDGQIARLKSVSNTKTQTELAEILSISQPSVAAVFKKRRLPASWLLIMAQKFRVNPIWILSATQPVFIASPQEFEHFSDSSDNMSPLKNISLAMLIDEVQRRLNTSQ